MFISCNYVSKMEIVIHYLIYFKTKKEYHLYFSGEIWDTLNDFTNDAGFHLIFDASVFLRTPDNKWDPSNFQELLRYNANRGYKVDFQLGNGKKLEDVQIAK